jgi:UDP-2,3-diacylglucosamine pyrophosphatase LpxH
MPDTDIKHYRSIFISDVHLGSKYSQVDKLIEFLKNNECDTLYLVGDIIDAWALKRKWFWDNNHNLLIQKILRKSRKHTRIIYLTGNHDDFLRNFEGGLTIGDIEVCDELVYTTLKGKKYLVIHGDKFDGFLNSIAWLSHIGSMLYDVVLYINDKINWFRRKFKWQPWSLAQMVKTRTKEAVKFMTKYEDLLVNEARHQKVDGVICGHIHRACHKSIDGIEYYNCGSWIENCNAVVETVDGDLKLLNII